MKVNNMAKDSTTIRIKKKTKARLEELRGIATYDNIVNQLIEFFLTKK